VRGLNFLGSAGLDFRTEQGFRTVRGLELLDGGESGGKSGDESGDPSVPWQAEIKINQTICCMDKI